MKDKKEKTAFERIIEASKNPELREKLKLINYENAKEAEKEINKLKIDKRINKLIITGDYPLTSSAEERDFTIHKALIKSKYDTPTIISIFINPHLGCSDETLKKGQEYFEKINVEAGKVVEQTKKTYGATIQQRAIEDIRFREKIKTDQRKKAISDYVTKDMFTTSNEFRALFDEEKQGYFIFRNSDKVIFRADKKSDNMKHLIRNRYGIIEDEWSETCSAIRTYIWEDGEKIIVHNFCWFDETKYVLYISNHDDEIFRLDGKEIKTLQNGDEGVFFLPQLNYTPIHITEKDLEKAINYFETEKKWSHPNLKIFQKTQLVKRLGFNEKSFKKSWIKKVLIDRANFVKKDESKVLVSDMKILLLSYFYSIFFESLLKDKPIVCFIGKRASGKSTLASSIGNILFGENFHSQNLPDTPRDLNVVLGSGYFKVFDNVDDKVGKKMLDVLCGAVTGSDDEKRTLYKDIDITISKLRLFFVLTTREGKFKRDDLVSRLILLNTKKLNSFTGRRILLEPIIKNRNKIMAEVLVNLNSIVKSVYRTRKLRVSCISRIADWESFIRLMMGGKFHFMLIRIMRRMESDKSGFSLEDNILYSLLTTIVIYEGGEIRDFTTKELYEHLSNEALELGLKREFAEMCSSPISLGIRISDLREDLEEDMIVEINPGVKNVKKYSFYIGDESVTDGTEG